MKSTIVPWSTNGAFHALKAVIRSVNTKDVSIEYFLDGVSKGKDIGKSDQACEHALWWGLYAEFIPPFPLGANFVNSPLYFIINLQVCM